MLNSKIFFAIKQLLLKYYIEETPEILKTFSSFPGYNSGNYPWFISSPLRKSFEIGVEIQTKIGCPYKRIDNLKERKPATHSPVLSGHVIRRY